MTTCDNVPAILAGAYCYTGVQVLKEFLHSTLQPTTSEELFTMHLANPQKRVGTWITVLRKAGYQSASAQLVDKDNRRLYYSQ